MNSLPLLITLHGETSLQAHENLYAQQASRYITLPSSSDRDIQPIDVYKLFCTDEVIHLIVTETNRFFEQTVAEKPITRLSKMNAWKPVTIK